MRTAETQFFQTDRTVQRVVTQLETKVNDVISETAAASATKTTAIRIEDLSTFYIDTTVNELDVNSIQPGQAAEIQFIGIPDKTYHGR